MSIILETQGLTKRYGKGPNSRLALDGLDLQVEQGAIFGFVGPNGAGKTTTIRILTTLLKPSAGDAWVGGYSIATQPHEVRHLLGYMPDFFGTYGDLQVGEYLEFFARCYRVPRAERAAIINDLLELVDMTHRRDDMVESLSRGLKQRLSLARTLLHDPQVLILDEPASGLDPRARVEIRDLLVELARMGKTIFFSTHILSDVSEICTDVAILEAGKLVASGNIGTLQQQIQSTRIITIEVLADAPQAEPVLRAAGLHDVQPVETNHLLPGRSRWQASFHGDDRALSDLLTALVHENLPVVHFSEQQTDIEDVFMQLTQGIVS